MNNHSQLGVMADKRSRARALGLAAALVLSLFMASPNATIAQSPGESAEQALAKGAAPPAAPAPDPECAPPLPPVSAGIVENGDRTRPRVAITFDACENEKPAHFDHAIWKVLVDQRVKATIFLGGKWMEHYPDETRMIGQNPLIEIGNHSYIHPDFTKIDEARVREEIKRTQDIQWRLMGRQGVVFRFPYGFYDDKSLKIVAEFGLYPIQWDVVSGDPSKSVKAKPMIEQALKQTKNGSIIIFHINGRGWHTAEALPAIVDGLRKKGFELVTVSELMGYEAAPGQTSPVAASGK